MAPNEDVQLPSGDTSPNKKPKLEPIEPNDDETLRKVCNQLEYYFSDVNIVNDKFLLDEIQKDEGWISLTTLLTFQRLKQLTKDPQLVAKSLETHGTEGFLELSECGAKVRRSKPLPDIEKYKQDLELRTLHISGFPLDSTFDYLYRFCERFGDIESVSMRRHFKTRAFKGCIMAVFKKEKDAQKVLDMQLLKLKDRELLKENLVQFHKRKQEKKEKYLEKKRSKNEADTDSKKEEKVESEKKDEDTVEVKKQDESE